MTEKRLSEYKRRILKECSTDASVGIVLRELVVEAQIEMAAAAEPVYPLCNCGHPVRDHIAARTCWPSEHFECGCQMYEPAEPAAAAPGGGVRAPEPYWEFAVGVFDEWRRTLERGMFPPDEGFRFMQLAKRHDEAKRVAVSAEILSSERSTPDRPRDEASSSSLSDSLRGLATELRAACQGLGYEPAKRVMRILRLADRLDVVAGESAKVDK